MKLLEIVKDNFATFQFYRQGYMYYEITVAGTAYVFPVEVSDLGTATLNHEEKAITMMRYIRKAMNNESFVLSSKPKDTDVR